MGEPVEPRETQEEPDPGRLRRANIPQKDLGGPRRNHQESRSQDPAWSSLSSGSSWLILAHHGSSWLLLAPPGSSLLVLAPPSLSGSS